MITESIAPVTGTCSHCQRADVPCLEFAVSDYDEPGNAFSKGRRAVVVCVSCLDAARVKRDVRRTRFDAPPDATELAPGITSTPGVCGGEPCIAGTRWRTSTAREYHYDSLRILRDYPHLTVAQVDAAIAYERELPAPVALPVLPATCGECGHYNSLGECRDDLRIKSLVRTSTPPRDCPLRKGAA